MAHGTKPTAAPAAPSNGLSGSHVPLPTPPAGVNRKKQKRREKEAAKKAAEAQKQPAPALNGMSPSAQPALAHNPSSSYLPAPQYADPDYDEALYDHDGEYFSDEEGESYEAVYAANGHYQPEYAPSTAGDAGKKTKKKKRGPPVPPQQAYQLPMHHPHEQQPMPPRPLHMSQHAHPPVRKSNSKRDRIWNTSTNEERERIREFWLSLGEDERKSLVKIEKEAVLRKMKEQQKHSCSCSVCGRKRTAIEEELEVLYDAYYEELEGYAIHWAHDDPFFLCANHNVTSSAPHARTIMSHPPPGAYDDTDDLSGDDEDGDQDFSNSEISSEEDYSDDERSLPPPEQTDFLQFGSSLQVKGNKSDILALQEADLILRGDSDGRGRSTQERRQEIYRDDGAARRTQDAA
jgi:hypothetical protein